MWSFGNGVEAGAIARATSVLGLAALLGLATSAQATEQTVPAPSTGAATDAALTPAAKALIAAVQKKYDGMKSLSATFNQKVKGAASATSEAAGTMSFRKPGMLRFDYRTPHNRRFIAKGGTMWLVEPDRKEAQRLEFSQSGLPAALSFLWGEARLAETFDITQPDRPRVPVEGATELKLAPRKPSPHVREVYLAIDPKTHLIMGLLLYDHAGTKNMLLLSDVRPDGGPAPAEFEFTPPKGYSVMEVPKP